MAVEVKWDNPHHTIISTTLTDRWTWADLSRSSNTTTATMLATSPHIIHLLVDIPNAGTTSMSGALLHIKRSLPLYADNWGIMVIVNKSPFINLLIDMFKRIHPEFEERLFIVKTRDDAYEMMTAYDEIWLGEHLKKIV